MHLGNLRTFLLAWLSARARGGTLRLRIEDIDGPRVKTGATAQTIADLQWLGFDWDGEVWQQSARLPIYRAAVDQLLLSGGAYPCVCSRKEANEAASAPHEVLEPSESEGIAAPGDESIYPGTCRGKWRTLAEARSATGRDGAVRFQVRVDAVPFVDGFRGPQPGRIAGDFVIQKRDGGPAYQLAVVIDDAAQGITEVLRGDDLLPSTPRQLLLYAALGLGRCVPAFTHVPLVVGSDGLRLAKRHGDTSLAHYRAQGITAARLIGHVAWLAGLLPRPTSCMPRDLLAGFDLTRVPRGPVRAVDPALDP